MLEHQQYNFDSNVQDNFGVPIGVDFISTPSVYRTDKTLNVKNFYIFNDQESYLGKGQRFGRTVVSGANYSVAASDYLIAVTSLSVAPSVGLPLPVLAGAGKTFIVKDEVGGAATTTITIRSDGEKLIDGASTSTLTVNYDSKSFYTDGTNWFTKK